MKYSLHNYTVTDNPGSLIDRGANGGFCGDNVLVIDYTGTYADVTGLADHAVTNVPIATCAGKINSTTGPVICILYQTAYFGQGNTVHSCAQMEAFGLKICDRSRKIGGDQRILTPEGYVIPLAIRDGLAYMDMTKPTEEDMDSYPHVILTSNMPWDPRVLDDEYDPDGSDAPVLPEGHAFIDPRVNAYGEIISRQARVLFFDHSETNFVHYGNSPEDYAYGIFRALNALTLSMTTCSMTEHLVSTMSTILSLLRMSRVASCMSATYTRQALKSNLLT
jgi:hypothetical protein